MAEIAKVVSIEDEHLTGVLQRTDACGDCHACDISENKNEMIITAYNKCNAKVGDNVEIELNTSAMMKATLIMYVLPLITMVGGFLIGNTISEAVSFILGLTCMLITYVIIRLFNNKFDKNKYKASATKVVKSTSSCSAAKY